MAVAHVEAPAGQRQAARSGRPEQAAPPIALTLRAMHREAPSPAARSARLSLAACVSVGSAGIGLLPGAGSGRTIRAGRPVLRTSPSPADGGTGAPAHEHQQAAKASNSGGGAGDRAAELAAVGGVERQRRSRLGWNNPSGSRLPRQTGNGGGTGQQGSPGNGNPAARRPATRTARSDGQSGSAEAASGGSSPLVPILIAIAVLAAISVGVSLIRQRRQRGRRRRRPVSPKAS